MYRSILRYPLLSVYCCHWLDAIGGSNFGQRRPMGPGDPPSGPSRGGSNGPRCEGGYGQRPLERRGW
jgi:hypothetical protein